MLGPNGAGKTTTIRLLLWSARAHAWARGSVGLRRTTATQGQQIRDHVGALLEHTGLYERLSAEDSLDYFASIWNMTGAMKRDRIRELLTSAGGRPGNVPALEAYAPSSNTWEQLADMPTPRHGMGAVTVGDAIFVIGGGDRAGFGASPANERFTPP